MAFDREALLAIRPHRAETLRLPGVLHGFFTREGGVSTGLYDSLNCGMGSSDVPETVLENRSRVAAAIGVATLMSVHQIHSAEVAMVAEPWLPGQGPRADAMVTDRPDLALGILTADCAPVLFADGAAGVVAAAHAGWKGAIGGVLQATIEAMEQLGGRRDRIVAVVGPCISSASYEVGAEFEARFAAEREEFGRYFTPAGAAGKYMFDLPGFCLDRLLEAGVAATATGLCTYADEKRFFSYRRTTHRSEPDYGRQLSVIALDA
ncbi:MAG: peptidoglycan editing factor PgeF [Parvibaculaceae bacterium]|nr:peptidoglycan editing factor PgeF [Parvibaculaceae bacterium]